MLMAALSGLLCLIMADLMEIFHMESFIRAWQAARKAPAHPTHPTPKINGTHTCTQAPWWATSSPSALDPWQYDFICPPQINSIQFVVKLDQNEKDEEKKKRKPVNLYFRVDRSSFAALLVRDCSETARKTDWKILKCWRGRIWSES